MKAMYKRRAQDDIPVARFGVNTVSTKLKQSLSFSVIDCLSMSQ